jgi:hypothetical protein
LLQNVEAPLPRGIVQLGQCWLSLGLSAVIVHDQLIGHSGSSRDSLRLPTQKTRTGRLKPLSSSAPTSTPTGTGSAA